jgi:hypothetical protein
MLVCLGKDLMFVEGLQLVNYCEVAEGRFSEINRKL